jgi:hypothetical protein
MDFFLGLPFVPCHASHGRHWGGQLLHDRANHHQRFVCQRNQIENVGCLLFRHSSRKVIKNNHFIIHNS